MTDEDRKCGGCGASVSGRDVLCDDCQKAVKQTIQTEQNKRKAKDN